MYMCRESDILRTDLIKMDCSGSFGRGELDVLLKRHQRFVNTPVWRIIQKQHAIRLCCRSFS